MAKRKKEKTGPISQTEQLFRTLVVKADGAADIERSQALELEREREIKFQGRNALDPPFSTSGLCRIYEISNALRQNIDAYETNIDSFGHTFVPTIDFESPKAIQQVREVILLTEDREIDDAEAEKMIEDLKVEAAKEKARLKNFFNFCICDGTFISLRRKTRRNLETVGWGAIEVLRDKSGEIAQFVHVPSCWIRLLPAGAPKLIEMTIKKTPITFDEISIWRRFRTFIQLDDVGNFVYFKELGDDRIMSSKTGIFYDDLEQLNKEEEGIPAATELWYMTLSNHSLDTPYGKPRWIGNLLSILGSREAEEVNFLYFQNKSVPPMAILVMGGRLQAGSVKRLEDYIENHLRGKRNFHKILIVEAMPFGKDEAEGVQHSGKAKIEIVPLTQAQVNDALFQNYDEKNRDKVGESFRVPRILRGDTRDFNRSTGEAAIAFAESQVFQPERDLEDAEINRKILNDMKIRFWEFKSLGPITKDSQIIAKMISDLVKVGVLTPEEARVFAEDVFNMPIDKIDAEWTKQPLALTLAGIGLQMADNGEMGFLPGRDNRINEEPQEKVDLSTGDLAQGGLQQPAQGCPPGEYAFGECPKDKKKKKLTEIPVDKIENNNGTLILHIPTKTFKELVEEDQS